MLEFSLQRATTFWTFPLIILSKSLWKSSFCLFQVWLGTKVDKDTFSALVKLPGENKAIHIHQSLCNNRVRAMMWVWKVCYETIGGEYLALPVKIREWPWRPSKNAVGKEKSSFKRETNWELLSIVYVHLQILPFPVVLWKSIPTIQAGFDALLT